MPNRFGLAENIPDLDVRIQRIREEIAKRQPTRERARLSQAVAAQRPTGLRLTNTVPGNIEVGWNRSPNSDVLYYELQFSPDLTFPEDNRQAFRVPGSKTEFSYTEGVPGEETFFRMRTVTRTGAGQYSSIVSGNEPGQAIAPTVEVGASSALSQLVQTELNPVLLDTVSGPTSGDYGFLEVESTGDVMVVVGYVEGTWVWRAAGGGEAGVTVRLKEDGEAINEAESTQIHTAGTELREVSLSGLLPGVVVPTAPPPGAHVYSTEIEVHSVGGGNYSTVNLSGGELHLSILDLRR